MGDIQLSRMCDDEGANRGCMCARKSQKWEQMDGRHETENAGMAERGRERCTGGGARQSLDDTAAFACPALGLVRVVCAWYGTPY